MLVLKCSLDINGTDEGKGCIIKGTMEQWIALVKDVHHKREIVLNKVTLCMTNCNIADH